MAKLDDEEDELVGFDETVELVYREVFTKLDVLVGSSTEGGPDGVVTEVVETKLGLVTEETVVAVVETEGSIVVPVEVETAIEDEVVETCTSAPSSTTADVSEVETESRNGAAVVVVEMSSDEGTGRDDTEIGETKLEFGTEATVVVDEETVEATVVPVAETAVVLVEAEEETVFVVGQVRVTKLAFGNPGNTIVHGS